MLTPEQKMLMAQMIFNEKEVLFGEFGPDLSKVEKQEKWMEILVKLNSVGANLTDYKVRFRSIISKFFFTNFSSHQIDFRYSEITNGPTLDGPQRKKSPHSSQMKTNPKKNASNANL